MSMEEFLKVFMSQTISEDLDALKTNTLPESTKYRNIDWQVSLHRFQNIYFIQETRFRLTSDSRNALLGSIISSLLLQ